MYTADDFPVGIGDDDIDALAFMREELKQFIKEFFYTVTGPGRNIDGIFFTVGDRPRNAVAQIRLVIYIYPGYGIRIKIPKNFFGHTFMVLMVRVSGVHNYQENVRELNFGQS